MMSCGHFRFPGIAVEKMGRQIAGIRLRPESALRTLASLRTHEPSALIS